MSELNAVSFEWRTMLIQLLIFGFPLFSFVMFVRLMRSLRTSKEPAYSEKLQELEQRIERLEKKVENNI